MFDVTIQQLRVLREVASEGTMSAAADSLGYTPSAISQQVAGLERAIGQEVFERIGRTVRLNDVGRRLITHAEELLAGLERAEVDLEQAAVEPRGVFTVGVFESFSLTLLGPLLKLLAKRHPKLEVHSREYILEDAPMEVHHGVTDLALVVDYPHARHSTLPNLESTLLFTERFSLVVPSGHRLASGPVSLDDLRQEPLIGPPSSVACGRCVELACRSAGFEPIVRHQIDDYPSATRLVADGHGVSLLPRLALVDLGPGVEIVDLVEPVEREVRMVYRTSSQGRPTLEAVLSAAHEVASDLR